MTVDAERKEDIAMSLANGWYKKTGLMALLLALAIMSGPTMAQDIVKSDGDSLQTAPSMNMMKKCMAMMEGMHEGKMGMDHQMKGMKPGQGMMGKDHQEKMGKDHQMKGMKPGQDMMGMKHGERTRDADSSMMGSNSMGEGMMSMAGQTPDQETCKRMMEKMRSMHEKTAEKQIDKSPPAPKTPEKQNR